MIAKFFNFLLKNLEFLIKGPYLCICKHGTVCPF